MNFQKMKNLILQSGNSKKYAIFGACFLLIALVAFGLIYEGTKKTVIVNANGEKQELRTHADTVKYIIE